MSRKSREAGRPIGHESTRSVILASAREAFSTKGFLGVSMRSIAAMANVDPSTVIHFFGNKDGLFQAVLLEVIAASQPLDLAFKNKATGAELVRIYLEAWEEPDTGQALRALIRTSLGSDDAMQLLRENLSMNMLDTISTVTHDRLDAELILIQLISLGFGRYIAQLPELVKQDVGTLALKFGSRLDRFLKF